MHHYYVKMACILYISSLLKMCWTFPLAKFNQLNPHGNKTARGARENEPRELILTHTEGERKRERGRGKRERASGEGERERGQNWSGGGWRDVSV